MVDISAIGIVATSLNTAVNIAKAMVDVRDATVIQGKVFELQRAGGELFHRSFSFSINPSVYKYSGMGYAKETSCPTLVRASALNGRFEIRR